MTVTGKTLGENLAEVDGLQDGQTVVRMVDNPIKPTGHLRILRGNLAPEGAVAKITGKEGLVFSGTANIFDAEEDMIAGLEAGKIKKGDVVIIRYEGPKGGPGMPEMLTPTSAIMGAGLGKDVALLTDGRFPAARMVSSWAISRRKLRRADRSRSWRTEIQSRSMRRIIDWKSASAMRKWQQDAPNGNSRRTGRRGELFTCLLYTSDAADE